MAYIALRDERLPGISGLLNFSPETAHPLNLLAETILRGSHSTLTPAEREIIASSVSHWNDCTYCHSCHGSAAAAHLGQPQAFLDEIKTGLDPMVYGEKLVRLLAIARQVQESGRSVTPEAIQTAKQAGASDREIHDTVLIAAAFCMYNRYVDGLGTTYPTDKEAYIQTGVRLAFHGYVPQKGE